MLRSTASSYAYAGSTTPLLGFTIPDYLDLISDRFPGNEALVDVPSGRRWTYREFRDDCRRLAKSLLKMGINRGDRVASGQPIIQNGSWSSSEVLSRALSW
jgi:fatty-acyl-CoA synthase